MDRHVLSGQPTERHRRGGRSIRFFASSLSHVPSVVISFRYDRQTTPIAG